MQSVARIAVQLRVGDKSLMSEMSQAERALSEFRRELQTMDPNAIDLGVAERRIQELLNARGRELLLEVMSRADAEEPEVVIHGEVWGNRREVEATYQTTFGELKKTRSTYQRSGRGRVSVPMELRLGMVEGTYSPKLARILARATALMPNEEAAGFLDEVGVARVSVSTLHRIPRAMAARYEQRRVEIESYVRTTDPIPVGAVAVQVGMDGVMVPCEGENERPRGRKTDSPEPPRHEQRYGASSRASPADDNGETGRAWHEASVATLAFFDDEGVRLKTTYLGEMPEAGKATLARRLREELTAVLAEQPELHIIEASDGAPLHWRLHEEIHQAVAHLHTGKRSQLVDFFHVAEYLGDAAAAIFGEGAPEARVASHTWGETMRAHDDGARRVLSSLRYHRKTVDFTHRKIVDKTIEYIAVQNNAQRAGFAQAEKQKLPIGTGVTEAAAKTLVSSRMKRTGARYSHHGGQTILHFRSALLSERFDALLGALEDTYAAKVTTPRKAA